MQISHHLYVSYFKFSILRRNISPQVNQMEPLYLFITLFILNFFLFECLVQDGVIKVFYHASTWFLWKNVVGQQFVPRLLKVPSAYQDCIYRYLTIHSWHSIFPVKCVSKGFHSIGYSTLCFWEWEYDCVGYKLHTVHINLKTAATFVSH